MANAQKNAWSSGLVGVQKKETPLSGFEQITKGIPEGEWLNRTIVVQYVRDNFETRYVPERLIAALGLRFSDPELNDNNTEQKQSKLLNGIKEEPVKEDLPACAASE